MIYKELKAKDGKIEIDGIMETYRILEYDSKWSTIQIIRNSLVTSVHSVPTTAPTNIAFRTGGNRYKIIAQAEILKY